MLYRTDGDTDTDTRANNTEPIYPQRPSLIHPPTNTAARVKDLNDGRALRLEE